MVMGSRMQHGSAQPTAAHALQGKRNARVVGCDEAALWIGKVFKVSCIFLSFSPSIFEN